MDSMGTRMMQRDQLMIILNKMTTTLKDLDIKKWPGEFNYDLAYNSLRVHRLELINKRCNMLVWHDRHDNKLGVQFKVGSNVITTYYSLPNILLRWTCPAWRTWNSLSNKVTKAHKDSIDFKAKKEVEEQISTFNELYYFSFPEEIDNILLDDESDD
jgi:hypothetical protein